MIGYIDRKRGIISMGETVQYSGQSINNKTEARRSTVTKPVG